MSFRSAVRSLSMAVLALSSLAAGDADAAGDRFRMGGYLKNFCIAYDLPDPQQRLLSASAPTLGSVSNRLRLDADLRISQRMNLNLSYNIVPRVQDPVLFKQNPFLLSVNPYGYRFADLDRYLYPDDPEDIGSFAVAQNLDRAVLSLRLPHADIYVGRQVVAWGSARMVNPTDIVAPFAYTELDTENRVGVDAVRVRIPVGFMAEIDAGYVAGDDFELRRSAVFLRGKTYVARTDVSGVMISFQKNLLIGLDIARAVGGAGLWFESAWVSVDAFADNGASNDDDYFRMSSGMDYSLGTGTYIFLEYHYNQAGSNRAADYWSAFSQTAYREGTVYLLGKHYAIPGISHQLSPLITSKIEAIVNLGDPSLSLMPHLEYNVAENVYLAAGAYIGIGQGTCITTSGGPASLIEFKSEFGAYPDFYHTSFRVYF